MRASKPLPDGNRLLLSAICLLIAGISCGYRTDDDLSSAEPTVEVEAVDDDARSDAGEPAFACWDVPGDDATSEFSSPRFPPEYYVDQSLRYFDTLDSYSDPRSIPNYSDLVARWEWPPWLLLTGFGDDAMIWIDLALRLYPTRVLERDCRAFDFQPFGRCRVVFEYNGEISCPIYEEFTFNDLGEMTFIEAWSDLPGFMPTDDANDAWAEGPDAHRLSTKIPGLGNDTGRIDLSGECMGEAARADEDVAEFRKRARMPVATWVLEFLRSPDGFEIGCP
ncbi:MAG: hypothetical protein KJ042_05530 [Deltaproteobacteria bacterium]|nr:hypothetical protein [Deltaproteobacteria bacterium]